MSGHYGPHSNYSQPPYHYGPLQPEWQPQQPPPSRSSWQDPRPSGQASNAEHVDSSASATYNPNTYGPLPGAAPSGQQAYYQGPQSQSTSTWGVRYNQGHQNTNLAETKPPLPPRPSSTIQHVHSPQHYGNAQQPWPAQSAQSGWSQGYDQSHWGNLSSWSQTIQQPQQPSSSITPPPPPPRPPAYQNLAQSVQGWPDHQYSDRPPSHRYEPAQTYIADSTFPISSQTPGFHGQTIPSLDGSAAEHTQQAEQPAVSPISPENESHNHFSWEHPNGQSKISSPTHEQRRPSPIMSDASALERPPNRFTSPPNDVVRASRSSTENRNTTNALSRDDSFTPELQKTDTIDDLITSWQQPLHRAQSNGLNPRISRHSSVSALDEAPSPVAIQARRSPSILKSEPKQSMASLDPILQDIVELKPESRASLERYLTALRREGAAATDSEKYRAFKAFMDKEIRLKAILYGVDEDEPRVAQPIVPTITPQEPAAISQEPLLQLSGPDAMASSKRQDSTSTLLTFTGHATQVLLDNTTIPQRGAQSPPTLNEESYVLVGAASEGEYSPGGRPRIPRPQAKTEAKLTSRVPAVTIPTVPQASSKGIGSPSDYAPMLVEDIPRRAPGSPGANAPIVLDPSDIPQTSTKAATSANKTDISVLQSPPQSAYTPFKYNEGPSNTSYAELRQAGAESGRLMSQTSISTPIRAGEKPGSPSVALRQQKETFLGLIREKSMRRGKDQGRRVEMRSTNDQNVLSNISGYIKNSDRLELKENPTLTAIQKDVESIPDEFGFIRQTVLAWDQGNRERIKKLEAGRRQREEQSEANIDQLFNAKQIGYPDIKTLESEFKRNETQTQQEEYREELNGFVNGVFKPVTTRLDSEIRRLEASYKRTLEVLENQAVSLSQLIASHDENDSKPKIASLLEFALQIFDKLQIRYRKRIEAEREQQRRSALCDAASNRVLGNLDDANKIEADYVLFEKQSAMHAAEEHDARANKLMDSFDAVVVRALGENEQFINDLKKTIQQADAETRESRKINGDLYGPTGLRQTLSLAESVLSAVSADSTTILQSSDTADQLLNNADYDLSVTKARLDNADENIYQQLHADKAKEDEKIRAETASRQSSMNKGPEEALHLVRSIIARIGGDPEHQERIKKALEAAKKRNAARET